METRREAFARTLVPGRPERRTIVTELRAVTLENGEKGARGHGAVFDQEAEIWDGIFEVVRAGAFTKTIKEADVRALFNHDPNLILGRNKAGTLTLSQDKTGLAYDIALGNQSYALDLYESLQRGDVTQSSYAFLPVKETWTSRSDGSELRELMEVQLFDVSPVTYPAFVGADAQARSALFRAGIDPDGLARISLAHQRGSELSSADRAMLKAAIEAFSAMLPASEPAVDHSENPPADRAGALASRRARLALALQN